MIGSSQFETARQGQNPPAPFRRTASGDLQLTRGGGIIAILGSPFFLAGLFMLLAAARVVPLRSESASLPAMLVPMGIAFFAVGSVMVFGRQRLTLDLGRRSMLRQWLLLVPVRTDERPISDFSAIVVTHDRGDSERAESYPVTFRSSNSKSLTIIKPLKFAESLSTAQYLAQALNLDLVDATTDREMVVNAGKGIEPLGERISQSPAREAPPQPPSMRSQVTVVGAETRIVLLGGGPTIAAYAGLYLPIFVFFIALLFAIPFLFNSGNPFRHIFIVLLLFGLPTAVTSTRYWFTRKRQRTIVRASHAGLVIEQPPANGIRSFSIPANDIFDVDYSTFDKAIAAARRSAPPGSPQSSGNERIWGTLQKLVPNPGIVIKAHSGITTVGEGLPADELRYLVWLIRNALAS